MFKKLVVVAALAGGGYVYAKKHLLHEGESLSAGIERAKQKLKNPISDASNAAKLSENAAQETIRKAEEASRTE